MFTELLLPTFLVHLTRGLLVSSLPLLILQDYNLSTAHVGLAVGAVGLGKIIGDIPSGIVLGRIGAKKLMIVSGVVITVSSLIALISISITSFPLLVLSMGVFGVGQGAGVLSRLAMVSDNIDKAQRGTVSAYLGGSARIAMAVGPVIAGLISSISLVFIVQAVCAGISVTVVMIWGMSDAATREHVTSICPQKSHLEILIPVSIFALGLQIIRECRKLIIPLVGYEIALTADRIGWYASLSNTADAVLFPAAGWIMDKYGRVFCGVVSVSIMSVSQLIVVPGLSESILVISAILSGVGNGLSSGIQVALGADLAPSVGKAEFLGFFRLVADSGEFIGPAIVGVVSRFTSIATMINVICTLALAGVVWFMIRIDERAKVPKTFEFGLENRK